MGRGGSSTRVLLCVIVALSVLVIVLLAVTIHLATRTSGKDCSASTNEPVGVLKYNNVDEALIIKWYPNANTEEQVREASSGGYTMVTAHVSIRPSDNVPLVGPTSSGYTLEKWLTVVMETKVGIQIMISDMDELEPVFDVLTERVDERPVFVGANVLGVSSGVPQVDHKRFTETVNRINPDVTLSLGWTVDGCDSVYGRGNVEDMWGVMQSVTRPVNLLVQSTNLKQSWPNLKWLLEKSRDTTMTVTSCPGSKNGLPSSYDLLYIYNDFDKRRIFFDIPSPELDDLKHITSTAGIPMDYFNITDRDAGKVTWAHAVNSVAKLQTAIKEKVMMFEADINLGVGNQSGIPIMTHDAGTYSDLTFDNFVQEVLETKSGLKLDFKSLNVVGPSLQILQQRRDSLKRPVWINADIFQGFSGKVPVNATEFLKVVNSNFPECILSIGWTTGRSSSPKPEDDMIYSKNDVEFVADFCRDIKQPITFPIRAAGAKKSWQNLQWLLDQSRSYSLTIWHTSADTLSKDDMNYIRQNSEHSRVYFDLPDDLLPDM